MHGTWTGDCFTYDNIHVSMLFSQIIPPSPLLGSIISRYSFHSLKKSNSDIKRKTKGPGRESQNDKDQQLFNKQKPDTGRAPKEEGAAQTEVSGEDTGLVQGTRGNPGSHLTLRGLPGPITGPSWGPLTAPPAE